MPVKNHNCKCPLCKGDAVIYLEEKRYKIRCLTCGMEDYLKIKASTKTN